MDFLSALLIKSPNHTNTMLEKEITPIWSKESSAVDFGGLKPQAKHNKA